MRKSYKIEYYYVIFDSKQVLYIRKYLSKVEDLTSIAQNTLSKHFSVNKTPYKNDNWEVFKTSNVDLIAEISIISLSRRRGYDYKSVLYVNPNRCTTLTNIN